MTDLSRFYYKDTPISLITIYDIETRKIHLFQVTILYITNFIRNIQY